MKSVILKSLVLGSIVYSSASIADNCQVLASIVAKKLESNYVIEDTSKSLSNMVLSPLFKENCSKEKSKEDIAQFFTNTMNNLAKDKHLSVVYDPEWVKELTAYRTTEQTEAFADSRVMETPTDNYGFKKVELLAGNIGYLDIRMFADSHLAGSTLENAMKFLQHADGMIIDLRNNFGGSPFMVSTLASYFFDVDTVHLSTFETRENGVLTQIQEWTSPYVPGPRFKNIPLYILTSRNSASAAESFSYAMKNLKRAVIVGEVTAGAAHGRRVEVIDDDYLITLPTSRPVDPRTYDNWERKGVKPDIETASESALSLAYAEVLNNLRKNQSKNQQLHQWFYPLAKAKLSQYQPNQNDINRVIGQYGKRKIFQNNTKLFYQYGDDPAYQVELLDRETMIFKSFDDSRLQAVFKNNKVIAIKMLSLGGQAKEYARTM